MTTKGFEINYTDPATGLNLPTAWVVPGPNLNDPIITDATGTVSNLLFTYNIWEDQQKYLDQTPAIFENLRINTNTTDSTFLQYFTPQLLAQMKAARDGYLAAVVNNPPAISINL